MDRYRSISNTRKGDGIMSDTYTCRVKRPGSPHRGCGGGARVVSAHGKKDKIIIKKMTSSIVTYPAQPSMLGLPATKARKVRRWTAELHRGDRWLKVETDLPV